MLKRNTYRDFGQFVAALKAAERLDLRYRVERRAVVGTRPTTIPVARDNIFAPQKFETRDEPATWTEYTLDILPDEDAPADERGVG